MSDAEKQPTSGEHKELTEEQKEELRQKAEAQYYDTSNGIGSLFSSLMTACGSLSVHVAHPHSRCLAGGGLIATALTELAARDKAQAHAVFSEMAAGLIDLGDRLGIKEAPEGQETKDAGA